MYKEAPIPTEILDANSRDFPEIRYIFTGPTKELNALVLQDQAATIMVDSIERKSGEKDEAIPRETTVLYLFALKHALEEALKRKRDFQWNFNPTDPAHKMERWFKANSEAENPYRLRISIPAAEVESEIKKIDAALNALGQSEKISVLKIDDYITKTQALSLESGQKLFFDAAREGRNLAGIYGEPIEFIRYLENTPNLKAWPLISIKIKGGEKVISSKGLRLTN